MIDLLDRCIGKHMAEEWQITRPAAICIHSNYFRLVSVATSEALRQTNLMMKDRFEGLSAWREKQREERDFLENKLEDARGRMEALTLQNQELGKRRVGDGRTEAALGSVLVRI